MQYIRRPILGDVLIATKYYTGATVNSTQPRIGFVCVVPRIISLCFHWQPLVW